MNDVTEYDAIILGASYAGLAAASELAGRRVLLIDRKPIGTGQTSACATLVETMAAVDALDAVLQTHDTIFLHGYQRGIQIDMARHPFAVFDHARFCARLYARGDAEFRQESVRTVDGVDVITDRGCYRGPVVIEARGWRGIPRRSQTKRTGLNFGMETPLPVSAQGLHLYYNPQRWGAGYAWAFPAGTQTRYGICWFDRAGKLEAPLCDFLNGLGLEQGPHRHGGYFPWQQRAAVVDRRYVAGDAAGQCLGLLGEGIRPAIYFGLAAGRFAARVLAGSLRPAEGLGAYRRFAASHDAGFGLFELLQHVLPHLSTKVLELLLARLTREPWQALAVERYARMFDVAALLKRLEAAPFPQAASMIAGK